MIYNIACWWIFRVSIQFPCSESSISTENRSHVVAGEGWGRPHVEAMSMALPVIATNWSGSTAPWKKVVAGVQILVCPKYINISQSTGMKWMIDHQVCGCLLNCPSEPKGSVEPEPDWWREGLSKNGWTAVVRYKWAEQNGLKSKYKSPSKCNINRFQ